MRWLATTASVSLTLLVSASSLAAADVVPAFPTLVEIRAAHHPGFDRLVFEFEGGLPGRTIARWVERVTNDPSGRPAEVHGNVYLEVVLDGSVGHASTPDAPSTYGPRRRAFDLPNIAQVVETGDFEAVVSFGVGLMARTRILRQARLRDPGRFVVDVSTRFEKDRVAVAFLDTVAVGAGTPPFLHMVSRSVPRSGRARSALERLWAGPTQPERADGLRFRSSRTRGAREVSVSERGIARVTLAGRCDGGGEAITVADEVMRTLRPLPRIEWIKILDRSGATQHPFGPRDSVPECLAA